MRNQRWPSRDRGLEHPVGRGSPRARDPVVEPPFVKPKIANQRPGTRASRWEGQPTGSRPQGCLPQIVKPKIAFKGPWARAPHHVGTGRRRAGDPEVAHPHLRNPKWLRCPGAANEAHTRAGLFFLVPPRVCAPFFCAREQGPLSLSFRVRGPRARGTETQRNPTNSNPGKLGCVSGVSSRAARPQKRQVRTLSDILERSPGASKPRQSKSARHATFWN